MSKFQTSGGKAPDACEARKTAHRARCPQKPVAVPGAERVDVEKPSPGHQSVDGRCGSSEGLVPHGVRGNGEHGQKERQQPRVPSSARQAAPVRPILHWDQGQPSNISTVLLKHLKQIVGTKDHRFFQGTTYGIAWHSVFMCGDIFSTWGGAAEI